jgi:hypothetical protein
MVINKKTIIIVCDSTDDAQKIMNEKKLFMGKIRLSRINCTYQVSSTSPIDHIKSLDRDIANMLEGIDLNSIVTTVKFQVPTNSSKEVVNKPFLTYRLADDILETLNSLSQSDIFTMLTFRFSPSPDLMKGIEDALDRNVTVIILIDDTSLRCTGSCRIWLSTACKRNSY